jgi:hypothetical protein
MIKLISREAALSNVTFANFIYNWQKSYDPTHDTFMKTEGVYPDSELDKDRFYSQKECDEIRENQIIQYKKSIDQITPKAQNQISEEIFNLRISDTLVYTNELGNLMSKLSKNLNNNIIFFLELKIPWLYQRNEYKPVKQALNYLRNIGITNEYVGGIMANGEDLKELTTNLFWIIRCNAALPNCWFCDTSSKFVGDLCMHGNLHFHTFDENVKSKLIHFAKSENLKRIRKCEEEFEDVNEFGGTKGRETLFD